MMRALALLALLGAAPATDITPAATCTLPRAETEAAFRALPALATEDDTEADERGTLYTFRDATIWGTPAQRIKFSDYADPKAGTATLTFEAVVQGEYGPARDRLLAAHGNTHCGLDVEMTGSNSCIIMLAPDDGWKKMVTLSQAEGLLTVICSFKKTG